MLFILLLLILCQVNNKAFIKNSSYLYSLLTVTGKEAGCSQNPVIKHIHLKISGREN